MRLDTDCRTKTRPRSPTDGYWGRYLDVDLGTGNCGVLEVSREESLEFLGGKGVAAHILERLLPKETDPLSPENVVVINTGPLTATGAPGSSRFNMSTKSPLTGLMASSNSGGPFGACLKGAGYDGLVLRGRAEGPSWLEVERDGVRLVDASGSWGRGALEAQGPSRRGEGSIAIGPAGENLVRFACAMSGERVLGRCGVGAVLGSKNLKGITARGRKNPPVNSQSDLKEVIRQWNQALRAHPVTSEMLHVYGTAALVNRCDASSLLPTYNFKKGSFQGADSISGETLEGLLVGRKGCLGCPVRCQRVVKNPFGEGEVRGPEYEALALLGSNLGISSLGSIIEWNLLCDQLGMDTISAGATLGTAMELAERGLFDAGVRFGEAGGIAEMLENIALRRGVGDVLAEGAKSLAESAGAPEVAPHAKGLELPGYNPRSAFGHGLGYATANRGGCHINGGFLAFFEGAGPALLDSKSARGKASLVVFMQDLVEAISSCGGCLFHAFLLVPPRIMGRLISSRVPWPVSRTITRAAGLSRALDALPRRSLRVKLPARYMPFTAALEAITGESYTLGRFLEAGSRSFDLERSLNVREGLDPRRGDTLSGRFTRGTSDGLDGEDVPLEEMLPAYYRARGWDKDGRPGAG